MHTYPLDVSAILCQSKHAFVGNIFASRNVKSLKSLAVLGDGIDGLFGNMLVVGDVESQE